MKTVADLIDRNDAYYPRAEAFVMEDKRVTYGDFASRSRKLADALYRLGMCSQERIGILSSNNIEYFEIYGACEMAGYIAALYNFRSAPPEIAYLFKDSAPRVVIFEIQFTEAIERLHTQFKSIDHWICIGNTAPDWAQTYETLLESGESKGPPIRPKAQDYAYLF